MFLHRPSASSTKTFSARTEINFMVSSTISENTNIGPTFDVAAEHREEWEHRSQGSYYLFYDPSSKTQAVLLIHLVSDSRK